jgi:hypothetical protein
VALAFGVEAGWLAPPSEEVPHAAIAIVNPINATPMVAHRRASNAFSEADAIGPSAPRMPARPAHVQGVTEGVGTDPAAGERPLPHHHAEPAGTLEGGKSRRVVVLIDLCASLGASGGGFSVRFGNSGLILGQRESGLERLSFSSAQQD